MDPNASGPIEAYAAADKDTRELIHTQLDRNFWLAKQEVYLQWAGLIAGLIVTLCFLGVSAWLINGGNEVAGTILGTVDLAALVAVFVYGRKGVTQQSPPTGDALPSRPQPDALPGPPQQ
ncbi:hypothetical protein [Geodermatophilus amargosae]|uniref:hypothetical protein n=1 Tax=Geodermatophilus amargosae TaxID=1296565 RepID=UPI0034DFD028